MTFPVDREKRTTLLELEWSVRRHGRVQEVERENGRLTYQVKIWDHGRQAFSTVNFNDEIPARELLERIRRENEEAFDDVD